MKTILWLRLTDGDPSITYVREALSRLQPFRDTAFETADDGAVHRAVNRVLKDNMFYPDDIGIVCRVLVARAKLARIDAQYNYWPENDEREEAFRQVKVEAAANGERAAVELAEWFTECARPIERALAACDAIEQYEPAV